MRVLFEKIDQSLKPNIYKERLYLKSKQKESKNSAQQYYINFFDNYLIGKNENIKDEKEPLINSQELLFSDLFSAIMIDYIESKDLKKEDGSKYSRIREDVYMDIQLNVRNMESVEMSLKDFIKPEFLENDNKWNVEEIKTKVDAIKGLKFKTVPYLLTLHLKRFDYDYKTFQRIKLNNLVKFPFILDFSEFIEGNEELKKNGNKFCYELYSVLTHNGNFFFCFLVFNFFFFFFFKVMQIMVTIILILKVLKIINGMILMIVLFQKLVKKKLKKCGVMILIIKKNKKKKNFGKKINQKMHIC
jgi:hypothetical protein